MGQGFAWFFDIAIIIVLIVCIYMGGKKGFLRTAVLLIGYVIAALGGYFISKEASPIVYDKFLSKSIEKVVQDNIQNFSVKNQIKDVFKQQNLGVDIPDAEIDKIINQGGDLSENFADFASQAGSEMQKADLEEKFSSALNENVVLKNIKGKLPANTYSQIEKYLTESKDNLYQIIKALNNPSKEESAKELTELAVKPVVIVAIEIIIFMIAFSLLLIIVKLVSRSCSVFNKAPLIGPVNTLLGAALGAIQGILIVIVLVLIVKLTITLTHNDLMVFNMPTIEETRIFKQIYNYDFLGKFK